MPAQLSGLQNFGGGPGVQVSNALPNTPFLGAGAQQGTGVGSLAEFGGYIPTPLPQFNNYQDYLSVMPGAQRMDQFAEMPLQPGIYNWNSGLYGGFLQDLLSSPHAGTWDQAKVLGDQFTNQINANWGPAAQNMFDWANEAVYTGRQQGQKLFGLEDPIIQAAFDPQNALYGRTAQQLTDQTRAGLEARGMDMTPFGAGVEGSTMSNFNIDWQNNLLQRMIEGAQSVGGLASTGNAILDQAMNTGQGLNLAASGLQEQAYRDKLEALQEPQREYSDYLNQAMQAQTQYGLYGNAAGEPYQKAFQNWQDIQNQFLSANQQEFNQNQISGFEDPFSLLQLQSEIEMQREQMNMQEQMQKDAQKQQKGQQGAQAGMSAMGGMKGGM